MKERSFGETVWGPREDHEKWHLAEQEEDRTSTKGRRILSPFPDPHRAVDEQEGAVESD